jgi:hypothetical protein
LAVSALIILTLPDSSMTLPVSSAALLGLREVRRLIVGVGVPGWEASDGEPALVVFGLVDPVGVFFDPLVVEAAQGCEPVDVGGYACFPAAAGVVDFAEPGGDLASLGGAVLVAGQEGLALGVAGEAGPVAQI